MDGQSIHIVLHGHMDMGWLASEDTYYSTIVSKTLVSVTDYISKLRPDQSFVFTFADIGYLYLHKKRDPVHFEVVIRYVNEGRIELVGAGL